MTKRERAIIIEAFKSSSFCGDLLLFSCDLKVRRSFFIFWQAASDVGSEFLIGVSDLMFGNIKCCIMLCGCHLVSGDTNIHLEFGRKKKDSAILSSMI
ncbi:hypothetical protein KUTeg_012874 [Tegillarca granosa]|uniref:Uncharacterized protein n=1 Tax=Tegillarca granosa TaxID=220873 RepID=A0ABQ9ES53_TEGGR|nr:hypothetical protein KUTeg_012874 [Tegillarca granosa]